MVEDNKMKAISKYLKYLTLLIISFIGLGSLVTPTKTTEAKKLDPIVMGSRKRGINSSNSTVYDYLLKGTTSKGFLPDIRNLSKYGIKNNGWDIRTQKRSNYGGVEFNHVVFPSESGFRTINGEKYLRISGMATMPKYFHHTKANHQVAVLTKEGNDEGTIKTWVASPVDLTSSKNYTYGYGKVTVGGREEWTQQMGVDVPGISGTVPVHMTNNPYPNNAKKVNGSNNSLYFDQGYSNNHFGFEAYNMSQVRKLAGLGYVGSPLTDRFQDQGDGSVYIYDYTGFVIDIPADAIVTDLSKNRKLELGIVMTMTTPNGRQARVVGSELNVPGFGQSTLAVVDAELGNTGTITLEPSDFRNVEYNPDGGTLKSHLLEKDFKTRSLPNSKYSTSHQFLASESKKKAVSKPGGFKEEDRKIINSRGVRDNTLFQEVKGDGSGILMVGWKFPGEGTHTYTSSYLAYSNIPGATMNYRFNRKDKPIIVNHRILNDGRNPGQIFKREMTMRQKGESGKTFKPLSSTELSKLGSNLVYLEKGKLIADDTKSPIIDISSSGKYLSNNDLYSSQYNGQQALVVDLYYSGQPKVPTGDKDDWTYNVKHIDKATGKEISNTRTTGTIKPGQSETVYRIRPYGYVYNGTYKVDGKEGTGTSYRILHNTDSSKTVNVEFLYDRRELKYEVEHRNKETGYKIHEGSTGKIYFDNPKSYTTRRLTSGTGLPDGYTSRDEFTVNGGNVQSGTSYTVTYDDDAGTQKVVFWYDWNDPQDSSKRIEGDEENGTGLRPVDMYLNVGLSTVREDEGDVLDGGTTLEANTSAVIDTYKAPIAVVPVNSSISFNTGSNTVSNNSGTNIDNGMIYNDKYIESIQVAQRMGGSKDVDEKVSSSVNVSPANSSPMSSGNDEGMGYIEELGLGNSNARDNEEERTYVGRWVDQGDLINMEKWTPSLVNNFMRHGLTYDGDVNAVETVDAQQELDIYNIIKHNYEVKEGSDGIEYHEYVNSEIQKGYYEYDSNGNPKTKRSGSNVKVSTTVDMSDINTGEYVDSEGFKVESNTTSPVQFKVATETFDDGGVQYNGYTSSGHGVKDANYPVVKEENLQTGSIGREPRLDVDYYEEFGYKTNHFGNDLLTQQAITVGGEVDYVNPYDYILFPTATSGTSVHTKLGKTSDEVVSNVSRAKSENKLDSKLELETGTSGFYVNEIDDHDEFKNSHLDVTTEDEERFEEVFNLDNQHTTSKLVESDNYRDYNNSNNALYSQVESINGHDVFNHKLPILADEDTNELVLDARVMVGKDTGYPVVGEYEESDTSVEDKYKEYYESDLGSKPTDTDELIELNDGNTYLVPLKRDKHKLTDKYDIRLHANKVGISQFSLLDENRLTTDKYLYGRGTNTLYSGQREEIEVEGENLTVKGNTVVSRKDAEDKAEDSKRVDGVRTSNIVDIIKGLLR